VAQVAADKRAVLLRAYRGRLRHEDLEDCYGQAVLELVVRTRRSGPFQSRQHIANALEQKFCSRIGDRHRALGGRSAIEAALAGALCLGDPEHGGVDVADLRPRTEEAVESRLRLREVIAAAAGLTADQRLLLATQLQLDLSPREFCARFEWSAAKYRKVSQRGRARLRTLLAAHGDGEAPAARVADSAAATLVSRGPAGVGEGFQDAPMIPSPLTQRRVHGDSGSGRRHQSGPAVKRPRLRQRRPAVRLHGTGPDVAGGPAAGADTPAAGVAGTPSRLDRTGLRRAHGLKLSAAGAPAGLAYNPPGSGA
jgi:DNA-directed RNA polymerase specialized sigma24 family protein